MSYQWNAEEEALLRVLRPVNNYSEIAIQFEKMYEKQCNGFTTLRSSEAIRKKCDRDGITQEDPGAPFQEVKDRWELIEELGQEYLSQFTEMNTTPRVPSRKILCLSDMHFPFCRLQDLRDALENNTDSDIVVLNGDLFDGEIFSTFGSAKRVAAIKEYQQVFSLVKYCADNFPKVVITSGNHDVRPASALKRADFPTEATQVFRPDLLARVANGEILNEFGEVTDLVEMDNVYYSKLDSWYARIGKTIFAHPLKFTGAYPGATADKLRTYFTDRYGADAYDCIVCAHTHRQAFCISGGKLLIEQGALCTRLPYEHKMDLRFSHSTAGYCIIYQDHEGNTDFNNSHNIYLGAHLPPNKEIL